MLEPIRKNKFKKDVELLKRRGRNMKKLRDVMGWLIEGKRLDKKYLPHKLQGEYSDCIECHIEPDWLLIYLIDSDKNTITFVRTGTHSDLFK